MLTAGLYRVGDLSLAKQCAKVIGKPWDEHFSDCYTGKEGRRLLQDSGQWIRDLV